MSKYVIKGENRIEGNAFISGSKNSALPIIAACILNAGSTTLYNVPNIKDTNGMFEILKDLGCDIKKKKNKVIINSANITKFQINDTLMREMRSSVIIAGALLARFRNAVFSYPGGCEIGARPIDLHINGFKKLGINIDESTGYIVCKCDRIESSEIQLDFPSVGATENLILASVFSGETIIRNVAMEPEIEDLQNFLNRMGANVQGAGSKIIRVKGVKRLKEISYNIMPDRIETGTFLCYAAATSGKISLMNCNYEHVEPVLNKLEEANCKIYRENNRIILEAPKRLKAVDIQTMPYPGFPTDMQSVFLSTLTTSRGTSVVTENIFENRFRCASELVRMGAKISISSANTAVVKGVKRLVGREIKASDLRGGAALVGAAIKAKGISVIDNIQYVERGYENFEKKLKDLNIDITKEG